MATKLYLEASGDTFSTPGFNAGWTDTTNAVRYPTHTTKASTALATKTVTDASSAQADLLIGQWISQPLTAGQTITGGQTVQIVILASETSNSNNLFLGWAVYVFNTTTLQKTVITKRNDATEVTLTTLTSVTDSTTSVAGNYTTVTGDRLVVEIGLTGNPSGAATHDGSIRIGSSSGSDLAYSDGVTTDNNPSVNLNTDTLSFTGEVVTASVSDMIYVQESGLGSSSNLSPTDDTYYGTSFSPGPNDTATSLHVGGFGDNYYSYLQFDLTGVTSVANSKLLLYQDGPRTLSPLPFVDRVTSSWDETTLTRTLLPTLAGESYSFIPAWDTNAGWQIAELSALVGLWTSGTSNFGLSVRGTVNNPSNTDSTFAAVNNSDTTIRPILKITPKISVQRFEFGISVSDSLTVTEDVVVASAGINISDTLTITESVTSVATVAGVSVSDALTVTENVTRAGTLSVNVFDTLTVNENVTSAGVFFVNVFDALTNTESVVTSGVNFINVFDTLTNTESTTIGVISFVNVFDTLTNNESVVTAGTESVSVFDALTNTESVTASETGGVASVFDTLTVLENVSVTTTTVESGSDVLTITELVTSVASIPDVSVNDTLSVAEDITSSTALQGTSNDSLIVTESVSSVASIPDTSVNDSLSITENVATVGTGGSVSVFDTLSLLETTSVSQFMSLLVFETLTLAENVGVLSLEEESGSDVLTVAESVSLSLIVPSLLIVDTISVAEDILTEVFDYDSGSDLLSVTELVNIQITSSTSVNDALSISETFSSEMFISSLVYDTPALSEVISMDVSPKGIGPPIPGSGWIKNYGMLRR